jgi:DNA polymerase III epsilon subunit-like protein
MGLVFFSLVGICLYKENSGKPSGKDIQEEQVLKPQSEIPDPGKGPKSKPVEHSRYCMMVFDCETTGFMRKDKPSYIIQLSWIILDAGFNTVKEESYYIKPPIPIPPSITAINHITDEIVNERGTPLRNVMNKFHADRELCKTLITHNYEFNSEFIDAETRRAGLLFCDRYKSEMTRGYICTMKESTNFCRLPGYYSDYKYPKLEELAKHCGVNISENLHDSLADCRVTAQCAKALMENGVIGL